MDRNAHVGNRKLRDDRAVHKLDQGMHGGLGVDLDVNLAGGEPKQPVRFNDLKAFIHQCGGVDRNAVPHAPGGMVEGPLHGGSGDLVGGRAEERASGGGQHQLGGFGSFPGAQALVDAVMLAVDRQQLDPALGGECRDQFPRSDENFLIGQGDLFTGIERCIGGRQPGYTHGG